MIDIILAVLGLSGPILNQARRIHARVIARSILILAAIAILGYFLNLFGYKEINIVLALVLQIVSVIIMTRPEAILTALGLGAAAGIAAPSQTWLTGIRAATIEYLRYYGYVLIWESTVLFILGTLPLEESKGAILVIAVGGILVGLLTAVCKIGNVIVYKLIYYYACAMICLSFLSLIPSYMWIQYTTYDVRGFFVASEADVELNREEKKISSAEDERDARILKIIGEKKRNGEKLEEYEVEFWNKAVQKRNANTLPRKIQTSLSNLNATTQKMTQSIYFSCGGNDASQCGNEWYQKEIKISASGKHSIVPGGPKENVFVSFDGYNFSNKLSFETELPNRTVIIRVMTPMTVEIWQV